MGIEEVLTQGEVDALTARDGVTGDAKDTESPVRWDFKSDKTFSHARLPLLEKINDLVAHDFQVSLYNTLKKTVDINVEDPQTVSFGEFIDTLSEPTSISLIQAPPLGGTLLLAIDAKLVVTMVDTYYGGNCLPAEFDRKVFSPIEKQFLEVLADDVTRDLQKAWNSFFDADLKVIGWDSSPKFIRILELSEPIVLSKLRVSIEGNNIASIQIAIPLTMWKLVSRQIDLSLDSGDGGALKKYLCEEGNSLKVELSCMVAEATVTMKELATLKTGDIIPIKMFEYANIFAENTPVLKGVVGSVKGGKAVKIKGASGI